MSSPRQNVKSPSKFQVPSKFRLPIKILSPHRISSPIQNFKSPMNFQVLPKNVCVYGDNCWCRNYTYHFRLLLYIITSAVYLIKIQFNVLYVKFIHIRLVSQYIPMANFPKIFNVINVIPPQLISMIFIQIYLTWGHRNWNLYFPIYSLERCLSKVWWQILLSWMRPAVIESSFH